MNLETEKVIEILDDAQEKLLEAIQSMGKVLLEGCDDPRKIKDQLLKIVLGDMETKVVAATYLLASKEVDNETKTAIMFRLSVCHASHAKRAREEAERLTI